MDRAIRTKVTACGGELVAWYRTGKKSGDVYYSRQERDAGAGIHISYLREGRETPVDSIEDMIAQIRHYGCSPVTECAANPVQFAILCGFLMRLGRVIELPDFWSFLDEEYGVASRELTPRMEGSQLRYTVACLGEEKLLSHLVKVSIDFETSAIQQARMELKAA